MSRSITTATNAAAKGEIARPVLLVEMDFQSGIVRLNSSVRDIAYAGYVYYGTGEFGDVSNVEDGTDMKARGITLTLGGIAPSMISLFLGEQYQGRPCRLYLALLDSNFVMIVDPVEVFSGKLDSATMEIGQTGTITVTAEAELADWNRPRVSRRTNEDQAKRHPGDTGLFWVDKTISASFKWGIA